MTLCDGATWASSFWTILKVHFFFSCGFWFYREFGFPTPALHPLSLYHLSFGASLSRVSRTVDINKRLCAHFTTVFCPRRTAIPLTPRAFFRLSLSGAGMLQQSTRTLVIACDCILIAEKKPHGALFETLCTAVLDSALRGLDSQTFVCSSVQQWPSNGWHSNMSVLTTIWKKFLHTGTLIPYIDGGAYSYPPYAGFQMFQKSPRICFKWPRSLTHRNVSLLPLLCPSATYVHKEARSSAGGLHARDHGRSCRAEHFVRFAKSARIWWPLYLWVCDAAISDLEQPCLPVYGAERSYTWLRDSKSSCTPWNERRVSIHALRRSRTHFL